MTTGGWIFMIVSWLVITAVLVFCYLRSIRCPDSPDSEKPPCRTADEPE